MNLLINELNDCCYMITSTKISERKKSIDALHDLLEKQELLTVIKDDTNKWQDVIESIHSYLIKEAEKMHQDEGKKSKTTSKPRYDVLLLAIGAAKRGCGAKLDVQHLMKLINEIFDSFILRKYYLDKYLAILCDFILSDPQYCSKITMGQWIDLLSSLKSFNYLDDSKVLTALKFLIKWAPLHKFPLNKLRDEFDFICRLCKDLKDSYLKRHKVEILELLIDFCRKNSSDCCLACCKLGEDVFPHLRNLYQPGTTDITIKELLFEFFLLQMKLHHPKGVLASDQSAYALSWMEWKRQLTTMYFMIRSEIKHQIRCGVKTSFFNSNIKQASKIQNIFVSLSTAVFRQVFNSDMTNVTQTVVQNDIEGEPSSKRQRVDISLEQIFMTVKENQSWQWIYILSEYLKTYPSSLNNDNFHQLLRIISNILQENKDSDIIKHSYDCLNFLLNAEKHVAGLVEIGDFNRVYESTLRCIGLNHNTEETHKLLQNMIEKDKIKDVTQIYETFFSGVLLLSPDCLRTFKVTANLHPMPELMNNASYRKAIIRWILKNDSEKKELPNVYMDYITAEVLIKLCLKQWPKDFESDCSEEDYLSFENVYEYNAFKKLIIPSRVLVKDGLEKTPFFNEEIYDSLMTQLEVIGQHSVGKRSYPSYLQDLIKKLCLFGNILSTLDRYNLLNNLNEILKKNKFEDMFLILTATLMKYDEIESKENLKYYKKLFAEFDYLLSRNFTPLISMTIRNFIPIDLLKCFFAIINSKSDEKAIVSDLNDLKILSVNILSNFCFYSGCEVLSDIQENILDTLTEPNYDNNDPLDYNMLSSFLGHLNNCPGGIIKDEFLCKILNLVQDICFVHFSEYEAVLKVFSILNELVKHILASDNTEVRCNYTTMLCQFYELRENYGFQVSLMLIKCIGSFIEANINIASNIYNETNLLEYVSEFLTSNYQEVRLEAIRLISFIFRMDGLTDDSIFTIQRGLFTAINIKSHEVFRIQTNNVSQERKVDETVARTSSVLHTYASLIISSSIWRRKLLYFLLHLVHDKKIDTESLDRILNLVAVELKFPDKDAFLSSYSDYLLNQWNYDDKNIMEFPYNILGIDFELQFYKKHARIIVPLLVLKGESDSIKKMCTFLNKSKIELYEQYFSEISAAIYQLQARKSTAISDCYLENVSKVLSDDRILELLTENLDNVIVCVIKTIVDEELFEKQFNMPFKLLKDKEDNSLQHFKDILSLLQRKLDIPLLILEHFSSNRPDIIQRILLHLHANIQRKFTPEDKLKALHQYATYIDTLLTSIGYDHRLSPFLTRDIVHTLLHLTSTMDGDIFSLASCKYLKKFCFDVTNNNFKLLTDHLPVIVNKLLPILSENQRLSPVCLKLLRHLLLDNSDKYKNAIEDLDPFPASPELADINEVYLHLRSQLVNGGLEDEIKIFLRAGRLEWNTGSRADALRHLHLQLSERKDELKVLYEKSKDIKGYTRNKGESILHNLIRMLLKLSRSLDNKVNIEATRCLGELGPLDLATLILQSKKPHRFPTSTPFQLLISRVIGLLSSYIIEEDVGLVQASSKALYEVLDSKEGKDCIGNLDSNDGVNKEYLYPFIPKRRIKASVIYFIRSKMDENVNDGDSWWSNVDHDIWIRSLTCKLLECFSDRCFLQKLIPVCEIKAPFCEYILPHLVHLIVADNSQTYVEIVITQINDFFEKIWNLTVRPHRSLNPDKKVSVQSMLDVIHFLRLNYENTPKLALNYLKVAQAAYHCSNYFAALMYIELWCAKYRSVIPGDATVLEKICEGESGDVSDVVEIILKQSYTALGDLDALYGSNFSHLINIESRVEHFKQFEKWDQALLHYDIQSSNGSNENTLESVNALKKCGYYHLATKYEDSRRDYECLWRLGRYDNDNFKGEAIDIYEKYKYEALKGLGENDQELFRTAIDGARQTVVETIKATSLESAKVLYGCLTKLQSIGELEDAARAKRVSDFVPLLRKWKDQDRIDKVDFNSVEPIKAQRISILNLFVQNDLIGLKRPLMKAHLDLADSAKSDGYFNVAMRTITNLLSLSRESKKYDYMRVFEEAQICWSMGNRTTAKYLIKHLLKINEEDLRLKFVSLKLYGTWMAETHSENPDIILNEYFLEPLKLLKGIELDEKDKQNIFLMYDVIARFTDAEYQRILSYIKSAEFERKVANMEKSKQTADKIEAQAKRLDYDQRKAIAIHKKQSLIDETEIENTRKEKDAYFKLAMKYYVISLQQSDVSNMRAFRILSLWLENRDSKDLDKQLKEWLAKIPSHKFVPILPQLAPHLTNNSNDEFGNNIMKIIERCAKDHPHHTLPIILALVNSNKDASYSQSTVKTESNEARVSGAQLLLNRLKHNVPELTNMIEEIELVADALIELAYTPYDTCQKVKHKESHLIPSNLKVHKIKNYSNMLLPTHTLTVRKSCNYKDVLGIHSYNKEFDKVGGINNPKRLYCRGTDGITRSQLLKGKDDLRQDAVMEQVFENINDLLHANKQTRHLLIRTYKVVPLSKRSGILEWVEESIPVGVYLIEAHRKYNPSDWSAETCRTALSGVSKKSTDEKLKKFKEVCKNYKPVFHKFFEMYYLEPLVWYERRKAYMHSVATTSMCGYILGLGDRHLQNILLDKFTAEVIHIDFGIAFEQGKVLPTPETVPFRLSRDIEDAMGVIGIEGIFRKSCEKTMEVMRKNHETIITILEVLLYDPLYEWTISPSEAYSMQFSRENDESSSSPGRSEERVPVNVSAERALLRLKQKLHGTEEGGTSSIEGQVEKLLQQARDPSNLCRLYSGWQAFL